MTRPTPQLAEVQWTWRRVFAMGRGVVVAGLVFVIVQRISDAPTLKVLALALIASDVLSALLYMAGATTTDVIRLLKTVERPAAGSPQKEA